MNFTKLNTDKTSNLLIFGYIRNYEQQNYTSNIPLCIISLILIYFLEKCEFKTANTSNKLEIINKNTINMILKGSATIYCKKIILKFGHQWKIKIIKVPLLLEIGIYQTGKKKHKNYSFTGPSEHDFDGIIYKSLNQRTFGYSVKLSPDEINENDIIALDLNLDKKILKYKINNSTNYKMIKNKLPKLKYQLAIFMKNKSKASRSCIELINCCCTTNNKRKKY